MFTTQDNMDKPSHTAEEKEAMCHQWWKEGGKDQDRQEKF